MTDHIGAPYAVGSDTSQEAAAEIVALTPTLRAKVLLHVLGQGEHGATCDEVEQALGLSHQTASARVHELAQLGDLVDSGHRRKTRSNRNAAVYVQGTGEPLTRTETPAQELRRLREALRAIAEVNPWTRTTIYAASTALQEVNRIAREALKIPD